VTKKGLIDRILGKEQHMRSDLSHYKKPHLYESTMNLLNHRVHFGNAGARNECRQEEKRDGRAKERVMNRKCLWDSGCGWHAHGFKGGGEAGGNTLLSFRGELFPVAGQVEDVDGGFAFGVD